MKVLAKRYIVINAVIWASYGALWSLMRGLGQW